MNKDRFIFYYALFHVPHRLYKYQNFTTKICWAMKKTISGLKSDTFHVISIRFLHFDEFYTLIYLYRVKLGSMSKFHKSCLSACLSGTLWFFEKIMRPNETYHISSLTRDFLSAFSMISFIVCILFDGYSAIESCVHSAAAILVY